MSKKSSETYVSVAAEVDALAGAASTFTAAAAAAVCEVPADAWFGFDWQMRESEKKRD